VNSFSLDVRCLDDRPPFFDLGVVKGGEPLRGLLLARSNIEAEISKAPAGSARACTMAPLSLPTTSFGMPLGAKKPNQPDM
jgi:hypothetical protein